MKARQGTPYGEDEGTAVIRRLGLRKAHFLTPRAAMPGSRSNRKGK